MAHVTQQPWSPDIGRVLVSVKLGAPVPTGLETAFPDMFVDGSNESKIFFTFALYYFNFRKDEEKFLQMSPGAKSTYIFEREAVARPSVSGTFTEVVAAQITLAELSTSMLAVLGFPWQAWTIECNGSSYTQETIFVEKTTLSAFVRDVAGAQDKRLSLVIRLSTTLSTTTTSTSPSVAIERAYETSVRRLATAKRKIATGKATSTPQQSPTSQQTSRSGRKGDASSQFQAAKKDGTISGPILWGGLSNMEGAHILPDKYADTTFAEIMSAVASSFLAVFETPDPLLPAIRKTFKALLTGLRNELLVNGRVRPLDQIVQTLRNDIIPLPLDTHATFDRFRWWPSVFSFRLHWLSSEPQPASVQAYFAHGESSLFERTFEGYSENFEHSICPAIFAAMARVVFESCRTDDFALAMVRLADKLCLSTEGTPTHTPTSSLPSSASFGTFFDDDDGMNVIEGSSFTGTSSSPPPPPRRPLPPRFQAERHCSSAQLYWLQCKTGQDQADCAACLCACQVYASSMGQAPLAKDANFLWSFVADEDSDEFDSERVEAACQSLGMTREHYRSEISRLEAAGGGAAVERLLEDFQDFVWTAVWPYLLLSAA